MRKIISALASPHHKKWIAVVMSVVLLVAFSMSTGSAHATSNTSHVRLNSSRVKPNSGPAGCNNLAQVGYTDGPSINYHGHTFHPIMQVFGWYATLNDGTDVFCDEIRCTASVYADNGSTYPPGYLGVRCGNNSPKSEWTGGGTFDGLIDEAHVGSGYTTACASFTPAGGSPVRAGWGFLAGDTLLNIPGEL